MEEFTKDFGKMLALSFLVPFAHSLIVNIAKAWKEQNATVDE